MASKIAEKMYGNSPKMEREESGKMAVKKKTATKEDDAKESNNIGSGQDIPVTVRHAMDRAHLQAKHETEHAMHDAGKYGDKHEMHMRHQSEMAAMHKQHEKELKEKTPDMGKEKEA